ncbi:MAG: AMP-binding protein [Acidiferrobacterales bacterium]|nr:AMP-binding protein [Acidiferrobacterales bacterium]
MVCEFYDSLETRNPEVRDRELFAALPKHLEQAAARSSFLRQQLKDVDVDSIDSRTALAQLNVVRKSELTELQKSSPPFGGMAAFDPSTLVRIFASPGPIFEPQTTREDPWRMSRALFNAGFRKGMLVHNTFSYHFSPAGAMLESGIGTLGGAVFPAGVGQTELQVQTIERLRPQGYTGTPSFLKIILQAAESTGADVSSLEIGLVSGEALPPSLRSELDGYGVAVKQAYATADVGLIAYESDAMEGLIVDEGAIVEIVRPGTGDPVPEGEVGEVVVTVLNPDYPLVRFATGDMSAIMSGQSPCGRTNARIKGWMGRADQTTKVRGMFVHPSQIAQIVGRISEVDKARLVVSSKDHQDSMVLHCEVADRPDGLIDQIASCTREVCKLRAQVVLEELGALANDGIVIEDVRTYD